LDVVALGVGEVAAGTTACHAWKPHCPQSGASFEAAEKGFGHAGSEPVTLGLWFECLGDLTAVWRWVQAECLVGFGAVPMFDFGSCWRSASGQSDEIGTHVRGFTKKGSIIRLEIEHHEAAEAFREFELSTRQVQEAFPCLGFGLETMGEFDSSFSSSSIAL
jgi:hypothetical protein